MKRFLSLFTCLALFAGLLSAYADEPTITIEGETLTKSMLNSSTNISISSSANTKASGGSYEIIKTMPGTTFPTAKIIASYPFTVTTAGTYYLSISLQDLTKDFSSCQIGVDSGEYTALNSDVVTSTDADLGDYMVSYTTNICFTLEAGTHYLNFMLASPRSDGRGFAHVDCFKLTKGADAPTSKVQASYLIKGTQSHTLSYADGASVYEDTTSIADVLNIKTLADTAFPSDGITATYTFKSDSADEYRLTIASSVHTRLATLSTYAISVNGGEFTTIDSTIAGSAETPNGGWDTEVAAADSLIGVYRTSLTYKLEQGTNTISVKLLTARDNDNRAWFYLHYLKLQLVDTFDHAEFSSAQQLVELGSVSTLPLNAIGASGLPMDMQDATLSFTSSAPAIIQVDKSGNVTALAPGSATISATVVYDGVSDTVELPVYVTLNGCYASPITWTQNGTSVSKLPTTGILTGTATVYNGNSSSVKLTLVLVASNSEGIKECKLSPITVLGEDSATLTADLTLTDFTKAQAFVLYDLPNQIPLSFISTLE